MGCSSSDAARESKRHLVIVGFQFAGINLLMKVKDHFRVTIIDKKDFFEWTTGTPHSIHDEEYWEGRTVNFDKAINKDKVFGKNVRFTQALLHELVDENTIRVKSTKGKTWEAVESSSPKEIKFDYLALCTGHVYNINEDTEKVFNLYNIRQKGDLYADYRAKIDKADSVLIVGGGSTGVEMVGEVLMKYGDKKKVAIANNGSSLLPQYPKDVGKMAQEHFESKGVKVHLNTRVESGSDLENEYSLVINCVGTKIHTPYMDANYREFKHEKGRIYVNEYFQVTNKNPLQGKGTKTLGNVFAFGDVVQTRADEPKNIPSIFQASFVVANNLIKSDEGATEEFQEGPDNYFFLSAVYFDDTNGAITIGSNVNPNPNMFADKGGFEGPYFTLLRNDPDGPKNWAGYVDMVKGMMGM
jgi:NADH dehydrogenase FAD-containing subunit